VKVNINAREELERRMDPEATRLEKEVAAERRARLDLERQLAELTARQHQRQAMVHRTSGGGGGAGEYRAPGDYAAFGAGGDRFGGGMRGGMGDGAREHQDTPWRADPAPPRRGGAPGRDEVGRRRDASYSRSPPLARRGSRSLSRSRSRSRSSSPAT